MAAGSTQQSQSADLTPPGGEKKDYLLKSVTPAGVVVEMVDGGQTVKISKGAMPAVEALAALAEHSAGRPQRDIREDAIKRGLTGDPSSSGFDPNLPLLPPLPSSWREQRDSLNRRQGKLAPLLKRLQFLKGQPPLNVLMMHNRMARLCSTAF